MSEEDKIVNSLIEQIHDNEYTEFDVECPYNNYGDKGVVDVVTTTFFEHGDMYSDDFLDVFNWYMAHDSRLSSDYCLISVIEVKSEYAVEESTGANEIIRQFRKHQEHFFEGSQYDRTGYDFVTFWLIFEDTELTRKHIDDNYYMYQNTDGRTGVVDVSNGDWEAHYLPSGRWSTKRGKPDWLSDYSEQQSIT